ncbi:MAG: hypothetical protein AAB442_02250 [Patescibacteria group bacterium]
MPQKVLPTAEEFEAFGRRMRARGFTPLSRAAFIEQLGGMRLVPPKSRPKREGRTLAFVYRESEGDQSHTVWVWTTYMPALGRAAENAAGWVLIVKGNSRRYSSHAVPRTLNFFHTLLWLAVIAKWRIDHRPACPLCSTPMDIAFGQQIESRAWRCRNHRAHAGTVTLDWKYGLPPAAVAFEHKIDQARAKRFAQDEAEGKESGRKIKRRQRWTREPP